jgi:O-antigen/teichoic acid export membrane protein
MKRSDQGSTVPGSEEDRGRGWASGLWAWVPRDFVSQFGRAVLWQGVGKLIQIVGVAYAARCLGPVNLGLSGPVMVTAAIVQLVLDLGLDIVAVRHVLARTHSIERIAAALFTLRVLVAACGGLVWALAVWLSPLGAPARGVWLLGAPYLASLVVNYAWYYQATQRLPRLSLLQAVAALGVSVVYLVAFRPGQAAGSDLWVALAVNIVVGAVVWHGMGRRLGVRLFDLEALRSAVGLVQEARASWLFNLGYYVLASMGLPLVYLLLSERESGLFRSASMLVTSLQMVLHQFALLLVPRIVAWREGARLGRRVLGLVMLLSAGGAAVCVPLWWWRESVYLLIYKEAYLEGAPLLPVLLFAKFLSAATAMPVWGLFALGKDWLAARCCVVPMLLELVLHFVLLPRYGVEAAAWLNCGAEGLLAAVCAVVFLKANAQREAAR